jgi:DNA recombination protein RmuC
MDFFLLIGMILCGAALGAGLGFVFGRYAFPTGVDPGLFALAQADVARLEQECSALRLAVESSQRAGEDTARLTERVAGLTTKVEEQETIIRRRELEREQAVERAQSSEQECATLRERVATQPAQLADLHTQLLTQFENIAHQVLKARATELSAHSEKALCSIVDPLKERVLEFQQKIESAFKAESREVVSLREQIRLVLEASNAIGNRADGLAKALRGDSQLLGRWGELTLERLLEAAGLVEGREYVSQGHGLGLKDDAGGIQRPDIILTLPEKRTMIVDSKVPLSAYERLIAARDDAEKAACQARLVRDVKVHIDGLANKRYQENGALQAHECVLMFVPIEGGLAAALTADCELFTYAWDRHVVLVGPSTLFMTMRTVASIWRFELQGQNTQDIAKLAGALCDKVSMSLADLNVVAEKLTGALSAHDEAVKRLSTGKGGVLSLGRRIRSLGVKTKHETPSMLVDGAPIGAKEEEPDEETLAISDHLTDQYQPKMVHEPA